jgi:hypothetical protein
MTYEKKLTKEQIKAMADEIIAKVPPRPRIFSLSDIPGSGYPPPDKLPDWNYPNWNFWKHSPEALPWQACALALNFDPDSIKRSPQQWMAGGGDVFMMNSFPSKEVFRQHDDLLRLLTANRYNKQHFTNLYSDGVQLSEFATWCAPVVRDLIGRDIPPELAAFAKAAPQLVPLVEAAPAENPDVELAALFDTVPVEALAKMFNTDVEQWKKWAEKAKANGLIAAREGTAMFNPYKAGVWFIKKGVEGWDTARLYRTLANNLPARSRDDAYRLTGGID